MEANPLCRISSLIACLILAWIVATSLAVEPGTGKIDEMIFFHEWELWKNSKHRVYSTKEEHDLRYEVFKDNLDYINKWNNEDHSFKLGLNQWADISNDEFQGILGSPIQTNGVRTPRMTRKKKTNETLDYRDLGAVTPVKDQGSVSFLFPMYCFY